MSDHDCDEVTDEYADGLHCAECGELRWVRPPAVAARIAEIVRAASTPYAQSAASETKR